jgi:CRP/FNR family transcriptional regulator
MKSAKKIYNDGYDDQTDIDPFLPMRSKQKLFEPGAIIRRVGEPVDTIYYLESGFLTLSKTLNNGKRQVINFVFPGEYCGLTNHKYYPFDIETVSFASVQVISMDDFVAERKINVDLQEQIINQLVYWSDGLEELIFLLGAKNAIGKTATFLLFLKIRQRQYLGDPEYKEIPLTRADIADFLGLTIETVSRTITKFKELKLIKTVDQGRVKILDAHRLAEIADLEVAWDRWEIDHNLRKS